MGKAAMIAVAAFLVIGATRQNQHQQSRTNTEQRDGETRFEMLSRNAALLGVEQAESALMGPSISAFASRSGSGSIQGANFTYVVTVPTGSNVATIWSRGYATDPTGALVQYKIIKKVRKNLVSTLPPTLPTFLNYALLVDEGIRYNGNVGIDTFRVTGTTGRSPNANIHSNSDIDINGNSADVYGFGTYVTTISAKAGIWKPYNPSSLPTTSQVSAVPMSTTFPAAAAALATSADRVTVGNQTLSGTYDFTALGSTRTDPYVWYVSGNLTASSSVTIKGYVVFVTSGNISLGGGASATFGDTHPESHAAWYAGGNMTLGGNSAIWGQFYVHGNLNLHGTPDVYGNIAVNGSATLSGNPGIHYIPASAYLTGVFQTPTTSTFERISYSEGWQ